MSDADLDATAGEYVLGTLAGDERAAFARRLRTDAEARHAVEAWTRRIAALLPAGDVTPSDDLWRRIDARLERQQAVDFGGVNVRAAEGTWLEAAPGVAIKQLHVDAAAGTWSHLLRLEPGAVLPRHSHTGIEECLVLSGDMVLGETVFFAGDYHLAPPGTSHPPLTSRSGGLVFIRGPIGTHFEVD